MEFFQLTLQNAMFLNKITALNPVGRCLLELAGAITNRCRLALAGAVNIRCLLALSSAMKREHSNCYPLLAEPSPVSANLLHRPTRKGLRIKCESAISERLLSESVSGHFLKFRNSPYSVYSKISGFNSDANNNLRVRADSHS